MPHTATIFQCNTLQAFYLAATLLEVVVCLPLTLQHAVRHCNTLHHTAQDSTTLQHCQILLNTATQRRRRSGLPFYCFNSDTATHFNTLQHTATHCITLRHTATHCDTLQHTASHCNTLRHTASHCITQQHCVAGTPNASKRKRK